VIHVFILFNLIFGLKIGSYIDTINILSIISIFVFFTKYYKKVNVNVILILLVIYGAVSNFKIVTSNYLDIWHVFQPWRAIINVLGISMYVNYLYQRKKFNSIKIIQYTNYAVYLHGIILIVTFIIPDLRYGISAITGFVDDSYLRSAGFTHSYGITSLCMLYPLLTYFYINVNNKVINRMGLIICFFSLLITARVGLYLMPIGIIITLALRGKIKNIFVTVASSGGVFALMGLFYNMQSSGQFLIQSSEFGVQGIDQFFNGAFKLSLEPIYNYIDHGYFSMKSAESITVYEYNNSSFAEMLFGTGYYGRGYLPKHLYTDISYLHFFSMVGIFGLLLLCTLYVYPLYVFKYNNTVYITLFALTVIILIGNYKEATFLTRTIFSLWCITFAVLRCMQHEKKSFRKKIY
jgi:hypothetical protein